MPEGEEQAPPGTRTMAIVRWSLVGLMALAAVAAWVDHARSARQEQAAAGLQYLCPMHPQIVTSHRGECPICGMDLVPAAGAKGDAARPAGAGAPPAASPGAAPVPGVAAVDLSLDRVQLIGMKSVVVTRQELAATVRAVGFVAANEASLVSVNTRFSGWVEQLHVGQTGQLVQQGEVLASLYSPEMLNAQQVFLNAIKWTERKPSGAGTAPTVASDLERDARLRLELLGVAPRDIDAISEAGQAQRAINVRSPVRGYVSRKSVVKGLYVQAGTELFQLADLSSVWLLVDVYESEISRVKVGQKATFELKAYPGRRFPGRVQFIYPALDSGSRTLQARIELPNPALELRPGMFGDVNLDLGASEAVVAPQEALIDTGDHQYVFVDRGGGRYEPRLVKAGWSGNGRVAILEGLADGERVVTTASFLLDSESRLRAAVEGFNAGPAAPHPAHQAEPVHGQAGPPAPGADAPAYTCPMHLEFVTPDPKARCPKCGMKLVPQPPAAPPAAQAAPQGPPARAPGAPAGQPAAARP
jgi:Cu(I)/Ag(I) efflux system membrane fusion protein